MEWVWRVREEPALWRRYFKDGLSLLMIIVIQIIPKAIAIRINNEKTK